MSTNGNQVFEYRSPERALSFEPPHLVLFVSLLSGYSTLCPSTRTQPNPFCKLGAAKAGSWLSPRPESGGKDKGRGEQRPLESCWLPSGARADATNLANKLPGPRYRCQTVKLPSLPTRTARQMIQTSLLIRPVIAAVKGTFSQKIGIGPRW